MLSFYFFETEKSFSLFRVGSESALATPGIIGICINSFYLSVARGLTDVRSVLLDEASFFEINQADEAIILAFFLFGKTSFG
jgi:hypothetical protein